MGSAIWLIRSIEQRRKTLDKVIRCIVKIQTDFFDKGIKYLKPLNLKQVAELVEVHESTVSRATSKKYIQTPQGLFELKYFFGSGVEGAYGSDRVSAKSIKRMLEEIIANENSAHPLSDQTIVEMLLVRGIKISRRTVAKYRPGNGNITYYRPQTILIKTLNLYLIYVLMCYNNSLKTANKELQLEYRWDKIVPKRN